MESGAGTILDRIIETKKVEVASLKQNRFRLGLPITAEETSCSERRFEASLRNASKIPVIAEIKRCSPSAGSIVGSSVDPINIAHQYESGNAACISVLTDEHYFGGSLFDLQKVSSVVKIPVLRKVSE